MAHGTSLTGAVALVTGGGRGLGRVYAQALAREGAAVALMSRTAKDLEETAALVAGGGGRARAYPGDVTDAAAVARTVAAVDHDLGPITILVNAAGIAEPFGPLAESDPAAWWRGVEINALGPFLTIRHVLPGMIARGRGRIVNVSSGLGTRALPHVSSYVIGKTALTRLTECVALETRAAGVTVFSISPGMVRTEMNRALREHPRSKEWFPWVHDTLSAGRDKRPEASAALVVRLVGGDADALTGRHVTVADDLDALIARAKEAEERQALLLRLAPLP